MPLPKLLCAKFGQVLPIIVTEIWPIMLFAKIMTLKGQGHRQINGTLGFLDLKTIDLDAKIIVIIKCLSSKVMVKDVFLHNGGQRNTFLYVAHSKCSRYFYFIERSRPKLSYVKIWQHSIC